MSDIYKDLKVRLTAHGEVGPVVKLMFEGNRVWGIGEDSVHHDWSLERFGITDGSVLDVLLEKPSPTCAHHDPSGYDIDDDGCISESNFPHRRFT